MAIKPSARNSVPKSPNIYAAFFLWLFLCGRIAVQKLLGAIGCYSLDSARKCNNGFIKTINGPDVKFIAGIADGADESFGYNASVPLQIYSIRTGFFQSGEYLIARFGSIGSAPAIADR